MIDYCIEVVDGVVNEKTQELDSTSTPDARERATLRAAITSDQVKVSSHHFTIPREKLAMNSIYAEKANPSGAVCGTDYQKALIGRCETSTTRSQTSIA